MPQHFVEIPPLFVAFAGDDPAVFVPGDGAFPSWLFAVSFAIEKAYRGVSVSRRGVKPDSEIKHTRSETFQGLMTRC